MSGSSSGPTGGLRLAPPRRLALAAVIAASAACSDAGPVSGPGTRQATLQSPHGSEGAAVVVLTGEGIGVTRPLGDTELFRSDADGTTRLVLIDQDGGPLAFEIELADPTAPLAVFIQEVAAPDDRLRADLEAYRLVIGP